jgi:hypothetical protein
MNFVALKHLENCFSKPTNSRGISTPMPRFGCELSVQDVASLRHSAAAAWLCPPEGRTY